MKSIYAGLEKRVFLILAISIFIITQIFLYYLLYIQIGRFTGDLRDYWFTGGHAVLEGKVPYRDFNSSYSPMFLYLLGFSYILVNHFSAPVLLFMCFAALTTVLLYKILRILCPQHKEKFTLLFLLSPILWVFTIGLYQDEIVAGFFLILSFYLWVTNRKNYSILALGLGIAFTKIIFLVFIPIFLLNSRSKLKHSLILLFTIIITFLPFIIIGADILQPIKQEINYIQGPTIWTILSFFGYNLNKLILPVFALILFTAYFFIYKYKIDILDSILLISLVFMLLNSKAIEFYALIFLPVFFLYISDKTKTEKKMFYLYNILIPISYFFTTPLYGGLLNNVITIVNSYFPLIASPTVSLFIVILINCIELFFIYRILAKVKIIKVKNMMNRVEVVK